jgi:hypothetical protein
MEMPEAIKELDPRTYPGAWYYQPDSEAIARLIDLMKEMAEALEFIAEAQLRDFEKFGREKAQTALEKFKDWK